MLSRFGEVQIAAYHPFSRPTFKTFTSPYLQDLMVFTGVSDVFAAVPEVLKRLLHISVSTSSVYRVTMAAAEAVSMDDLLMPIETKVAYLQIDGSLISTDDGWREVKVARVHPRNEQTGKPELTESHYCAHLGNHTDFMEQVNALVPSDCKLVAISDGAAWIENEIDNRYPDAVKILDYYHAVEHLVEAVKGVTVSEDWLTQQRKALLASESQEVLTAVETLPGVNKECALNLRNYYTNNQKRMDYAAFRLLGYDIGSGAIEAAHKTLIQIRMKRSGQRWNPKKAPLMLKLRVAYKSRRWQAVEKVFANN